ncbi:carboxylating nicotinate-nucleotide diphosphorylase [Cellulosilyticum lentocellum]|uniref:Probable nicotinate-nucleotide pyrophosphorylase [carboxylating] n=1 Tax=Cellulosilyticum lentocellum (strain ATCC 49066 / DSM 5427 / NCIMB 11756 / RHM5) TaxID=642492 RepID=F2JKR5_CELLD|nr:carboxylating nicotinate-nucleotide diphosphorylase [Cellulosilyticum lentocellum]ADZ83318.1 nicotinate-nucleotide pyrophosphorylase [Cellulosilyticum lentocellum DSM 5427]
MLDGFINNINVDEHILNAIKEDITSEDVTTMAIMKEKQQGEVQLICKEDGILAGLSVFRRTFELLGNIEMQTSYKDGNEVKKGEIIASIRGDIRVLLSGERTALNYLQRMSGIASFTHELVEELKGTKTTLLDTRKTTPGMRVFEKYAVKVGGGTNHRFNLTDGVLIKDNHIGAAGSITAAVRACKAYAPFVRKIEVEVENLDMVKEALEAGADIIMLDNMDLETMKQAVVLIGDRAQTECSGNVNKERLKAIAAAGVDYVSCGALTHSSPILDFSLKHLKHI